MMSPLELTKPNSLEILEVNMKKREKHGGVDQNLNIANAVADNHVTRMDVAQRDRKTIHLSTINKQTLEKNHRMRSFCASA